MKLSGLCIIFFFASAMATLSTSSVSEAANIAEEIVLRDGDQRQRQERRFSQGQVSEQELEIVYQTSLGEVENVVILETAEVTEEPPAVVVTPDGLHKGLVPQLWPNYTGPAEAEAASVDCNTARIKCAYRAGCGLALQNYALGCLDLVKGKTQVCSAHCRHSLIALMSTHEGRRLMKCNCSGDAFCEQSKVNIGACQEEVMYATRADTVVSCTAAQWICAADPLCATALEYYHRFCQAMFKGRTCTDRCLNSINILKRQPASAKLEHCFCDGTEDFDCVGIKANMEELCFKPIDDILDNDIDTSHHSSSSWMAKLDRCLIIFSVFATIIINWVGASFATIFKDHQPNPNPAAPPPTPEEIGLGAH